MKKTISTLLIFFTLTVVGFAQQDTVLINEFKLEEVVIKAARTNSKLKNLPHKIDVVKEEQIKNTPAKDAGELLKLNTSIDIIQYPGMLSAVSIRGFEPSISNKYSVILVNGIPVGTKNIATLSTASIEQIEVLKGPFSSLYGSNAMGGVINIVTSKSKDELKGYVDASYGSFQTINLKTGVGGKINDYFNFDLYVDFAKQGKDYKTGSNNLLGVSEFKKLIISDDTYDATFGNTRFQKMSANLRLGYEINKNWEINLYSAIFSAKDVLTHGSFWNVYGSNKKDLFRYSNSLQINARIGDHQFSLNPYYHNDLSERYNDLSDTTFIESNSRFLNYGFQFQDVIKFKKHTLVIGVDNETREQRTQRWTDELSPAAPYQPDFFNVATGIFAQTHLKFFNDKLNISAGARLDFISLNLKETEYLDNAKAKETFNTLNPNIGVKYEIIKDLRIHSSIGTAFFAPDAFQKAGTYNGWRTYVGNPDLDPETSNTFDLGIEYSSYKRGIFADVTFFNTNHNDLIVDESVDPDGIPYSSDEYGTYINVNYANMYGFELSLSYDLGALNDYKYSLKPFVSLDYLLNASVYKDDAWEDMKYVRKAKSNFGIEYNDFKHFSARLNARYIGVKLENNWFYDINWVTFQRTPYITQEGNPVRPQLINHDLLEHPEHLIINLTANYSFLKKYTFGILVSNLFNENYAEKDGYYMPGRAITGKFVVKF